MLNILFNRRLLALAILFLIAVGYGSIQSLPRAEDPIMQARSAGITTLYPGASASRVEALVSIPIEEEIRTLAEVEEVSSISRAGVSIVSVRLLDEITDVDPVWSRIRDKLGDVGPNLPAGAASPNLNDEGGHAYTVGFVVRWTSSAPADRIIMQRYATALGEALRTVPGTDYVRLHGDAAERVDVSINADALQASGLTVADIAKAIAQSDVRSTAGEISNDGTMLTVELSGAFDTLSRLRDIPIARRENQILSLGDFARFERQVADPPPEIAYADGIPAIFVGSRMQTGERVDLWVPKVLEAVDTFKSRRVVGLEVALVFEQAGYTAQRLESVLRSLMQGLVIIVFVLIFTMGVRAALSVGIAIPLTALMTVGLFPVFGIDLHQMSVIGVIVALGLMVDNAIIMTNDIRDDLAHGQLYRDAVTVAVRKLFFPLMASTATTILAFMPIVVLPGGAGEFVGPMSIAVICALISSFVISMFIVPALAPILFREKQTQKAGWLTNGLSIPWFAGLFRKAVKYFVRRPVIGLAVSMSLPIVGFGTISTVPTVFFPKTDRDQFRLEVRLPQSTVITETARTVQSIDETLRQTEGIVQTLSFVGAAAPQLYYNVVSSESANPAFADIIITTDSEDRTATLIPMLQAQISKQYPEASIVVLRYQFGPPVSTPIELKLIGPDLQVLADYGQRAAGILANTQGALRAKVSTHRDTMKLTVAVDEQAARLVGLDLSSISGQMRAALSGESGGFVLESTEQLPVTVRLASAQRQSASDIEAITLIAPTGTHVPLSSIATLTPTPAWTDIERLEGERIQRITSFVDQGELPSIVWSRFKAGLAADGFSLPPGYRAEFGGEVEQRGEAVSRLLAQAFILAVAAVTILVLTFNSFRRMAVIFGAGIITLGIGLLILMLTGNAFGFIIIIGIMGLIGVGLNDTIVIISALDENSAAAAGDEDVITDIVTGATARHIWSTTITTAGGFIPLIFIGGDFWPPFAEVFAGGLLLLTVVAFVFTPSAYRLFISTKNIRNRTFDNAHPNPV